MKKIIALVLAIIGFVIAAPITKEKAEYFATFSIEKVLGDKFFNLLWKDISQSVLLDPKDMSDFQKECYFMDSEGIYYDMRNFLYSNIISAEEHENEEYWMFYLEAKTIIIAHVKEYLHSNDNLCKFYSLRRHIFLNKLSKLNVREKQIILQKLVLARETFEKMKNPATQNRFNEWFIMDNYLVDNENWYRDVRLLRKNLPAKETAKIVLSGQLRKDSKLSCKIAETNFLGQFKDHYLAKFAGRRWKEGGDELLDKYIKFLDMMIDDVGHSLYGS